MAISDLIYYFRTVQTLLHMRHILWFAMLFFAADQLAAQVIKIDTVQYPVPTIPKRKNYHFNTDYWYTLALKTYSYEQFPQILDQPSDLPYLSNYLTGLLFKLNDNQISYRFQVGYVFRKNLALANECVGCGTAVGDFQHTSVKIGVEKNINYSRFQPYFGTDVGFMFQRYDGRTTTFSQDESGQPLHRNALVEDNKNALLISPLLGFKVYVVPKVAIGAEANFNLGYTYRKTNTYDALEGGPSGAYSSVPAQTKRYRWEYFFSPIAAVTLQYNFGLINQ